MKNNILNLILFMMISISSFTQSFNYELIPVDSMKRWDKWVIRTVSIAKDGGYTISSTPEMDSAKAIETFISIMDSKKINMDAEIRLMNTVLQKGFGKNYDQAKSVIIASKIAGNYTLVSGQDTSSVVINKNMQILSGKNKGTVKIEGGQMHISGSGIVTGTEILDIKSEGLFENKKVKLIRE